MDNFVRFRGSGSHGKLVSLAPTVWDSFHVKPHFTRDFSVNAGPFSGLPGRWGNAFSMFQTSVILFSAVLLRITVFPVPSMATIRPHPERPMMAKSTYSEVYMRTAYDKKTRPSVCGGFGGR